MVSKIFHALIYVFERVIGYLRSRRNCIASATLPLKFFAQRIPAMLIGCDEVEDEEELKRIMMKTDDIH